MCEMAPGGVGSWAGCVLTPRGTKPFICLLARAFFQAFQLSLYLRWLPVNVLFMLLYRSTAIISKKFRFLFLNLSYLCRVLAICSYTPVFLNHLG